MAEVKWIKIATDIFDDEKLLLIEQLPEAYAIITVWFKLLCMAGKSNNSGVFMLNDKIAYNEKMLATIFRMKEPTVRLALDTFEQFGMIEIVDGVVTIPNWNKHQSLDAYERKKLYDREYKSKKRAEQKALIEKSYDSRTKVVSLDIDKDKDKDIYNIYSRVIDHLNSKTGSSYRSTSKKTQSLIRARQNEGFTLDDFKKVIDIKCAEWMSNSEMQKYLRPETLFGTKFESYLNQKGGSNDGAGTTRPNKSYEADSKWLLDLADD